MSNKDIKFTQDSYIGVALKIVDKATQNNPNGVNVIFLDQRQGSIDGRSVNGSFSHDEGRKLKRITNESQIPMISKETVSEPSRQEMDDFEEF